MEFYSSEGLKAIALLVDDLLDGGSISQNALADLIGVSYGTIKGIRRNRTNADGEIFQRPDPGIVLELAQYITDPRTGKPFDPEDFLNVARGRLQLEDAGKKLNVPYPEAVRAIRSAMGQKSEAEFARRCRMKVEALREILRGRRPTWGELLRLGGVIYEDHDPTPLAKLYGVDVDAPIQPCVDENVTNGH